MSIQQLKGFINNDYKVIYDSGELVLKELDYMEYSSDANAQAAYVNGTKTTNVISNAVTETGSGGLGDWDNQEYRSAQIFTLTTPTTIISFQVRLYNGQGVTGNIVGRIETTSGGFPTGTLANANLTKVIVPTGALQTVTFDTPATLAAGTYALKINCDNQAQGIHLSVAWSGDNIPNSNAQQSVDGVWNNYANSDFCMLLTVEALQCFSESTIKTQGSYSLGVSAYKTDSLNETLTRTVSPTINLTGVNTLKFDIYALRTGANIKIGIHDSGGTTTEKTYTVLVANTWETVTWDISGVSDANKDAIDSIIITIVNADAANTFYIDNFYMDIAGTVRGTSLTISGLDGNTDEEYVLICRFIDDDTTGGYYLRFNNDSGNNYGYQYIKGSSSTASAVRDTSEAQIDLGYTNTDGNICFSKHLIHVKSGYVRTVISESAEDISGTTVTSIKLLGQVWNNTADNITSIVIGALNDKLNIGSRIILLKKASITGSGSGIKNIIAGTKKGSWERIYSTTLTEAATSVTISSLDGNTDILYRLRVRGIGVRPDTNVIDVLANGITSAVYGYQYVSGNNDTVASSRGTGETEWRAAYFSDNKQCMFETLIYAKSGYVRTALSTSIRDISGTTITAIYQYGFVWNNTVDNLTSLVLISPYGSYIGIGTYIILEKLVLS